MRGIINGCLMGSLIWAMLALLIFGQEKAKAPQLKPDVKTELVQTQNEQLKQVLQMRQTQDQIQKIYEQQKTEYDKITAKLTALEAEALKKSDIDPSKYDLNKQTYEVTEKPKP